MDDARLLEILRAENEALRERVAALEAVLIGEKRLPVEWRLTGSEARVFGVIASRELATKDAIHAALYGLDIDGGAEEKIVDVFVCKIRKKLAPFGINIRTEWGRGWFIDPAERAALQERASA